MNLFDKQCTVLFQEIGEHKKMVLSTSFADHVTSRMMSIIIDEGIFYFQTDKSFRKYKQLEKNSKAALCIDNLQIEGWCKETGHPLENSSFCRLYEMHFPSSFNRYTKLTGERLFAFTPTYVKKWIYEDGEPFEEIFDFALRSYEKKPYMGV